MSSLPPPAETDLWEENARLKRQLREARDRQAGGAEVLRTVASASGDADRALQQIVETTERLFGASSVSLLIAEGERWGRTIRVGDGSQRIAAALPLAHVTITPQFMPGAVYLENRQVHVADADDPAARARWPGLAPTRAAGTRTMSGTPLRREGKAIGALIVHRDRLAPFTEDELALLQNFADQAVIAIENTRLFNETKEALERQAATAGILQVVANSTSDVQPVFDAVAERAMSLLDCWSVIVTRFDGEYIKFGAARGALPDTEQFVRQRYKSMRLDRTSMIGRSLLERAVVNCADAQAEPDPGLRDYARKRGLRAVLVVPLLREDRAEGALVLTRAEPGLFAPREIELVQTFADQAVIAIENARLFNEAKEALERQTATADILKVIASTPSDVQPVFEAIATSANRLIGGFSTAVLRFVGDELHLAAFTPIDPKADQTLKSSFPRPLAEFPPFMLVRDGTTQQFTDTEAEDVSPLLRNIARLRGYRSMLFTPLMSNDKPIGMISVTRKEPGTFADHHIQLVRTFADQAVIAIENVRLFDEVQARTRELSRSLDDLRAAQDRLIQTEKLASLGQLTAGIAHEIKNPLNFVNNFAALSADLTDELNDLLKSASLAQKTREEVGELTGLLKDNLEKVVQHGKRADSIVKNMLLHSREGSGEHRPADINALLEESLNLAYHGARAEKPQFNVTLQTNFDRTAGMIDVFPQEITRVFLNLISNGFYAVAKRKAESGSSGFEPTVSAATRNLGHAVEIRIRDNGTGIAPEVKEKIFNPFFTTKPAGEGTGLGLSMSHDIIVKQHGGRIDVETQPGKFTEFTIVLPRANFPQTKNG
jgi:two-component system, NtrC family, sensor kinase